MEIKLIYIKWKDEGGGEGQNKAMGKFLPLSSGMPVKPFCGVES